MALHNVGVEDEGAAVGAGVLAEAAATAETAVHMSYYSMISQ